MLSAFERLIQRFPEDSSVMDVGYGGLEGENTTIYLRKHFKTIEGLCKDEDAVADFQESNGATDRVIIGLYPNDMPERKYDLLVLDPNIETNLAIWSEKGLKQAAKFLKPGGSIITYIMGIDEYGDEDTQKTIKEHRNKWWNPGRLDNLPNLLVVDLQVEERRPEITWVLLQHE